jgi:4a-hydroxytetrahydrobiopterin dehydratase
MTLPTTEFLCRSKCVPCEGGVPVISGNEIGPYLAAVPKWSVVNEGKSIERQWKFKNFVAALGFCNQIGELSEAEQHHPDLHLTGYRHVRVVLTTHAIGGLSENDFILAAKIDNACP